MRSSESVLIHPDQPPASSILEVGRNCWRLEPAHRAAFLIDGAAYYRAFREAAAQAEQSISRLNKISRRLAQKGVLAVIAVRVIPVAPFSLINLVAGASHIRFRHFLIGTLIGELPGLLGVSIFVDQIGEAARHPGPGSFFALAIIAIAIVVGVFVLRRWVGGKDVNR